jgi:hypothetical protein
MATQVVGAIVLLLTLLVGVWKWFKRVKSERRAISDAARKQLDEAKKNDSPSDFLDAFSHRL